MSIVTRTGDAGTTGLMYNHRVSKSDPRVEVCGSVDELSCALGMARALIPDDPLRVSLRAIQQDLIGLMGELATLPEDLDRYARDGYPRLSPAMTARLDDLVVQLEAGKSEFRGWAIPGETVPAAALDLARAVCRRAERHACALHEAGQVPNGEIVVYLNRLSDTLWLMARKLERA